jgi:hypothetical protein
MLIGRLRLRIMQDAYKTIKAGRATGYTIKSNENLTKTAPAPCRIDFQTQ